MSNRVGQVWWARQDSRAEWNLCVVMRKHDTIDGWVMRRVENLAYNCVEFGQFETQFLTVERNEKDPWLLKQLA